MMVEKGKPSAALKADTTIEILTQLSKMMCSSYRDTCLEYSWALVSIIIAIAATYNYIRSRLAIVCSSHT